MSKFSKLGSAQVGDIAEGATNIQAIGSEISISVGSVNLELYPPKKLKVKDKRSAAALTPHAELIPLIGRDELLINFIDWLKTEDKISVRTIIGSGGSGKTRFARELFKKIEDDPDLDWGGGFVKAAQLKRLAEESNSCEWDRPCLVVIDYAAPIAEHIFVWLSILKDIVPKHPLRIILLERHGNPDRGWLHAAMGGAGMESFSVKALFQPSTPIEMPSLDAIDWRLEIVSEVLKELESKVEPPKHDDYISQVITQEGWAGDPLSLMMAAMRWDEVGDFDTTPYSRRDLACWIGQREINHRLKKFSDETNGVDHTIASHLVAFSTLCGGLTKHECRDETTIASVHLGYPIQSGPVTDMLAEIFPDSNNQIAPIMPDLIGEAIVIEFLGCNDKMLSDNAISRALASKPLSSSLNLIRCVTDFVTGNSPKDEYVMSLLRVALQFDHSLVNLIAIRNTIPENFISLISDLLDLHNKIVVSSLKSQEVSRDVQADALHSYAHALTSLGLYEDAIAVAREASSAYVKLMQEKPQVYTALFVNSINTQSNILRELKLYEPALKAAELTVNSFSLLYAQDPDGFCPFMAIYLNNLANRLREAGRFNDSIDPAQRAVRLGRDLVLRDPVGYKDKLGCYLNTLAICYMSCSLIAEAIEPALESVELFRVLSLKQPQLHKAMFAVCLNDAAIVLELNGLEQKAVELYKEAIQINKELLSLNFNVIRHRLYGNFYTISKYANVKNNIDAEIYAIFNTIDCFKELVNEEKHKIPIGIEGAIAQYENIISNNHVKKVLFNFYNKVIPILSRIKKSEPDRGCDIVDKMIVEYLEVCRLLQLKPDESVVASAYEQSGLLLIPRA